LKQLLRIRRRRLSCLSWSLLPYRILLALKYQTHWVTCFHLESPFPAPRWLSLSAVPRSFAGPGSSSYELRFSFRVCSCLSPARHCCRTPSLGFLSPSRHQYMKSTYHRASHARLRFALSVSRALDDLLLHVPCGPVSSHCRVRDSHLRGFPRCQAGSPHR
jgi:hypothetical protein